MIPETRERPPTSARCAQASSLRREISRGSSIPEKRKRPLPVQPRAEPLLAVQQQSEKSRFQEERKHPLHGQRLSNHAAGRFGERGPVRAELKFHGDPGDYAEGKINSKDAGPEPRRAMIVFVTGAERFRLEVDEQQRETHGELGKEVMKSDGEGKVKTMDVQRLSHKHLVATTVKSGRAGFGFIEGYERKRLAHLSSHFRRYP